VRNGSETVTIADIATRSGVSKTAVSYAFNAPARLAPGTVARILAVAEELGYSPNPVARSMSIGRTGTIGVLVPQPLEQMLGNPFFSEFLAGVAAVAGEAEFPVLLVPPVKGSVQRAVNGAAVDGFLTLGLETFRPTMHVLERRNLPYVMVDSDPVAGVACVNIDDEDGAYDAMRHLLERGHRQIGILGIRSPQRGQWRKYAGTLQRRIAGYVRALAAYGLEIDSAAVRLVECEVSEEGGRLGLQRLARRGPLPTAIVAMSDLIAIGALEEAINRGLAVPSELSIVGFDGILEAAWVQPPLTTIRQPAREKGRTATALLLGLIAQTESPRHVVLATELVERQSVASIEPVKAGAG
jgi:DNA-binding LacI/PurR family transcriptional regulator